MKNCNKIFFRFIFRIILFLIFLEMFLRLGGWMTLLIQEQQNKNNLKGVKALRIVCIGDSNTILGGKDSFPSQLDVLLNKLDIERKYEVINKGIPAADSTIILEHVEEWVEEYKPDIVVSMMGANDRFDLIKKNQDFNVLSYLKVFSLIDGIFLKLTNLKSDKGINQLLLERNVALRIAVKKKKANAIERKQVAAKYRKILFYGIKLVELRQYAKAEIIFKNLVSLDLDIIFIDRAYKELGECLKFQGKYRKMVKTFKHLFDKYEYSVSSTDAIRDLCKKKEAVREIEELLLTLLERKPDSEHFNGLLGACYAQWGDNIKADKYINRMRELRMDGVILPLKNNYLKLAEILKKKNIKGVFVQYPMRSVKNLEGMFESLDSLYDIVIVDNEEIFKEALKPEKYKEYFTDRNYNDLGHCTRKGNYILAENTAKVIIKGIK